MLTALPIISNSSMMSNTPCLVMSSLTTRLTQWLPSSQQGTRMYRGEGCEDVDPSVSAYLDDLIQCRIHRPEEDAGCEGQVPDHVVLAVLQLLDGAEFFLFILSNIITDAPPSSFLPVSRHISYYLLSFPSLIFIVCLFYNKPVTLSRGILFHVTCICHNK
jgi:hypothetical protein